MKVHEAAAAALAACRTVLAGVSPADLTRPSPCAEYTVAEVGEHLARSMVLLGGVGGGSSTYPGGPLDRRITTLAEAALTAWQRRGLDGTVAVGRSEYPAALALEIIPLELLVHGWDVADATGQPLDVAPQVAEHVLAAAHELITPERRGRAFAEEVHADPNASALDRLVAFTGRRSLGSG